MLSGIPGWRRRPLRGAARRARGRPAAPGVAVRRYRKPSSHWVQRKSFSAGLRPPRHAGSAVATRRVRAARGVGPPTGPIARLLLPPMTIGGAMEPRNTKEESSIPPRAPGEIVSAAAVVDARRAVKAKHIVTTPRRLRDAFAVARQWVTRIPDYEIVNEIDNDLIAWKTTGGSKLRHAGSVNL